MYLYVNGIRQTDTDTLTGDINSTYNCYIGRRAQYNDDNFDGTIDEVKIYNKALSAEEIKAGFEDVP